MAANGGDEIQMKGREPVIEQTEDDGCSAVVGYIIQSVYHFFFSFFYSFFFRAISMLLIICTLPFSLMVCVKMVQVGCYKTCIQLNYQT